VDSQKYLVIHYRKKPGISSADRHSLNQQIYPRMPPEFPNISHAPKQLSLTDNQTLGSLWIS